MYYSRPGPADYNPTFTVQSKCQSNTGPKISVQQLPKGEFYNNLPKHRFSEYCKAIAHSELLLNKKRNVSLEGVNFSFIEKDRKLEVLKP
jgi:hypothetical protein